MYLIYRIYVKYKNYEWVYLLPLVLLSLKRVLQYYFFILHSDKGLPKSDDSQWYLDYAHALLADFKIGLHMNDLLYMGYNLILTLLIGVFKEAQTVIFIQAVTTALCVILVYFITLRLFNRVTAIIASYFYATSWHMMIWSMYILSDSLFMNLVLLNVLLLLKMLESKKKLVTTMFIISSLIMLIFRPTGVLTLAFIGLYLVFNLNKQTTFLLLKRYRFPIVGALLFILAVVSYLTLGQKFNPLIASLQYNAKLVLYNIYAKGWIYDNPSSNDYFYRPDYRMDIFGSLILSFLIHNWDHVLLLYGRRAIAFIGWWVWKTDIRSLSGLIKFGKDLIPLVLFIIGTYATIKNNMFRRTSIVWLVILSIFIFCMVLFMDSMYRYKLPALPFICIVCGYGAERLISLIRVITNTLWGRLRQWSNNKYSL
ncbi:glycosyltransferase family 39 protein [Paenibacillus qinlingensis]|uniref:4-amino-4-deoxy-L-arabinose transferase-like glycosyltransferase n=1 Tax=Paenibacillus qinlingensis TaxID=1837343 RepID=A0ABU1NXS1_9BACL|nr:glycosyltransferase family 39 protein [Paenibacillus qinlingensis]MDR6552296.1 4-amino-4-deoxy-L-arabinose transferase-like glycosyltransferase [Paenibacillus qinlingensis]